MRNPLRYYFFIAALIFSNKIQAQETQPGLQLSIQRQNNFTYATFWDINHSWQKDRYSLALRFHHDNLYNSFRQTDPFVQLYFKLYFQQAFKLNDHWELAQHTELDQFFNSGTQAYSLYAGATYRKGNWLSITPLLGYSWDLRSQILDQGLSPALIIKSQYQWEDGLQMQTRFYARDKYIQPRLQRNLMLQSLWSKRFNQSAALALGLRGGSNQMDNYTLGSVKQIKADTLGGQLNLQYELLPGVLLESANDLTYTRRQFDYGLFTASEAEFNDLLFNQIDFYTRQRISSTTKKLNLAFLYEYQYLGRRYELENSMELPDIEYNRLLEREQQKDYFRNLTNLELQIAYHPSAKHRITLLGSNRYLQYDTPADDNFDDHDELNYGLSIDWRGRWSRNFSTRYQLIGGVRRYAFLFKERSQDNYTQRNLRMEFEYEWQFLSKWRLSGQQFIYVTYNVKDFEDRNLTDRSTRNLETRMRLQYRHGPKFNSELSFYRKEIHVSYLNWDAFSETTLDTTTIYLATWENRWQIKSPVPDALLFFDFGYKHFSQLRFTNTAMINLSNILTPINLHIRNHQTGPTTGLRLRLRNPAFIEASVWWQLQYLDNKFFAVESFSTLSSSYRESELIIPKVNFRPFFQLKLNLWLTPK
ncbi:MAG: hypothetical protein AAF927_08205 [Bacteroidota bacterium]